MDTVDKTLDQLNRTIILRKNDCPVCKTSFDNWDVASYKVRIVKSELDLRTHFAPYDPLYYAAIVCPSCGYSALRSYFSKITPRQGRAILESITPRFRPKEYGQIYTVENAIDRFKQALFSANIKKAPESEKALISLQLSWLHHDNNDEDNEILFRENALDGFRHAYENEDFPIAGMDQFTLQYLLGELYRRRGQLDDAMQFIGLTMTGRGVPSRLKERAEDVKELILAEREYLQAIYSPDGKAI